MRFSGTYSRRCTFAPFAGGSLVSRQYKFDCTLTGEADRCLVLPNLTPFDCRVVIQPTVMRGNMMVHGDIPLGEAVCRPQGGNTRDYAASHGTIEYRDTPGATAVYIPVRPGSPAGTRVPLVGSVSLGGKTFTMNAEVPFPCDAVVDDEIGLTGETRYGEAKDLIDG